MKGPIFVPCEGSAEKALRRRLQLARGESEAASRVRENEWERREPLALLLLVLYIGNDILQATPWWGKI